MAENKSQNGELGQILAKDFTPPTKETSEKFKSFTDADFIKIGTFTQEALKKKRKGKKLESYEKYCNLLMNKLTSSEPFTFTDQDRELINKLPGVEFANNNLPNAEDAKTTYNIIPEKKFNDLSVKINKVKADYGDF